MAGAKEDTRLLQEKMEGPGTAEVAHKSTDALQPAYTSQKITGKLVYSIFTAVLGMFQFGYNTAVINAPANVIKDFYNETYTQRDGQSPSEETISLLWATTVAIFAVGGMFGGILGGWWAEKFGRKRGMMLNTLIGIVAGVLMWTSEIAGSPEMIIIGRIIVGFNCGLYTGLAPIYNSEVAPLNHRGAIGTVNQLSVTIAMLIAQVLGLREIMGTAELWPTLLGLTVVPVLLQLVLLPFAPESPRYLLLNQGKLDESRKALVELRGTDDVQEEMQEMISEQQAAANEQSYSMWELVTSSALRMPLLVAVMMHLSQQLSGINCIFYYSTDLFISVGLEEDEATYATVSVGGIMVLMTLVTIPLMDRAGRRTLHLLGLGGMFVFSIVFTLAFEFSSQTDEAWLEWLAIVSALTIVVFFALGPGSIPWMIVAELFSQGPRAAAVNIGVLVNWAANFIVGLSFPPLQSALEELVFVPFTVFLAFFFVFLFITLPETKGKTFEEISAIFNKKKPAGLATVAPTGDVASNDLGMNGKYSSFDNTETPNMEKKERESSMDKGE